MVLIFGTHAVKVSLASRLKNTNKTQQFNCNKNKTTTNNKTTTQAPIVNMINGLNFMFLFEC